MTENTAATGYVGSIRIKEIAFRIYVDSTKDGSGKEIPATTPIFLLSGINQVGEPFTKAEIRMLEPQRIVTNPTSSDEVIKIELPKAEYEYIRDLLKKTFVNTAEGDQATPDILLHYQSIAQPNRFNISFSVA